MLLAVSRAKLLLVYTSYNNPVGMSDQKARKYQSYALAFANSPKTIFAAPV
jgi:hypothetical protein